MNDRVAKLPPIGSMWRERRPYERNVVMVVGHDAPDDSRRRRRVVIDNATNVRRRFALAERFNGKAYTPYGKAEQEWLDA